MKTIPLTQGYEAIVDDEDWGYLSRYKWRAAVMGATKKYVYAIRHFKENGIRHDVRMHRLITEAPKGMVVDHKNHNTLDNRKENLRVCTVQQNMQNTEYHAPSQSKYKGVWYDKNRGAWKAQCHQMMKSVFIGRFKTEIEAARAYDEYVISNWGEFASTNFGNS